MSNCGRQMQARTL